MSKKLKRVGAGLGAVTTAAFGVLYVTSSGCATFGSLPSGERQERIEKNPHFSKDEGQFLNDEPTTTLVEGGFDTTKQFVFGNDQMRVPTCALPLYAGAPETWLRAPESGLRITWLGHSTTLIELDGARILTDPMFSERASPTSIAGPKRFHPPPVAIDRLPALDAVLISHDHYDHMDMASVQKLAATGVKFYTGLGNGAHLERWGVPTAQIVEVEWGNRFELPNGVVINSTPARHFSGRGITGRNRSLWTSWALVGPAHRVFFSGDTGLTESFEKTRETYGPFDVAMLEIGQWHKSWGQIHLGPEGALTAWRMLGAKRLFPIHWATFELGLHAWSEPAETLTTLAAERGVPLVTPMLGQPVEPESAEGLPAWWRAYPPTVPQCPSGAQLAARSLDDWAM